MTITRRVRTTHELHPVTGWGCTGIAAWLPDPFIAEIYGRDELGWWCACESRMRYEEV